MLNFVWSLTAGFLLQRKLVDAPSKKHLEKFKQFLVTTYKADLEGADEAQWRTYEKLKDLFEFLDDIFGDDEQEEKGLADDEWEDVKPAMGKRFVSIFEEYMTVCLNASQTSGNADGDEW